LDDYTADGDDSDNSFSFPDEYLASGHVFVAMAVAGICICSNAMSDARFEKSAKTSSCPAHRSSARECLLSQPGNF